MRHFSIPVYINTSKTLCYKGSKKRSYWRNLVAFDRDQLPFLTLLQLATWIEVPQFHSEVENIDGEKKTLKNKYVHITWITAIGLLKIYYSTAFIFSLLTMSHVVSCCISEKIACKSDLLDHCEVREYKMWRHKRKYGGEIIPKH